MSFVSSLLCCFGGGADDGAHENTVRSNRDPKRLSPAQSNIQKSLAASISHAPHAKVDPNLKPALTSSSKVSGSAAASNSKTTLLPASKVVIDGVETTYKDSSDSSKDTQSLNVHDETTIIDASEDSEGPNLDKRNLRQSRTLNDDSTGHIADNEQDDADFSLQQTERNSNYSTSTSSSQNNAADRDSEEYLDYEKEQELDLTHFQPGQSFTESGWLLNPAVGELLKRKCLILDLDETLVHSSFKYVRQLDFVIPVEIEGQVHNVYVIKRPGVDEFLRKVSEWYEVVVFTASVSRYGDPLLDILDKERTIHHRLFRDSCYNYQGNYIKNLSQLGRDLKDVIIIDNSPASYIFHPLHAVPISSWFSDTHDCELLDILPLLKDLSTIDDVRMSLDINL